MILFGAHLSPPAQCGRAFGYRPAHVCLIPIVYPHAFPCVPAAAVWTGVRLRDVLKAAGLEDDDANVNHIQVSWNHTDWLGAPNSG